MSQVFAASLSAAHIFSIMQPDTGTSPTASSSSDTLTLTSSDKSLSVDGNSGTKTINFKEAGIYAIGNSGSACTVDWSNGPVQLVTVNANCTFTFSNQRAGVSYRLIVLYSGTRTITWPTIKWGGAGAPTTSADTKKDLFGFENDGTDWLGYYAVNF